MAFLGIGLTFFQLGFFGKLQKKKIESRTAIVVFAVAWSGLGLMSYSLFVLGLSTPHADILAMLWVCAVACWAYVPYNVWLLIVHPQLKASLNQKNGN
jgi:hypothetical protein